MIKLHSPEPNPVNDQAVPSQRVEPARHEAMPDDVLGFDFLGSDVSGSEVLGSAALGPIDIEQQSQAEVRDRPAEGKSAMANGVDCYSRRRHRRMVDRVRLGRRRASSNLCRLEHKIEKLRCFHHCANDHAP